jgi:hypothetical protein
MAGQDFMAEVALLDRHWVMDLMAVAAEILPAAAAE